MLAAPLHLAIILGLLLLGGCASLPMAPAMGFMHAGQKYCVTYVEAMQTEPEPQMLLIQGECPVILED